MDDELKRVRFKVFEANDLSSGDVHEANTWVSDWVCILFLLLLFFIALTIFLIKEAGVNKCVAGGSPVPVFDARNSNRFLLALCILQNFHGRKLVDCDTFLNFDFIGALLAQLCLELLCEVIAVITPLVGVYGFLINNW